MAIFTGPLWPNGVVPFRVQGNLPAQTLVWIENLNRNLGVTAFVAHLQALEYSLAAAAAAPAPAATLSHVNVRGDTTGGSGVVGYGPRITPVAANTESMMVHELLHVLGFQHEQYHPLFGWFPATAPRKTIETPEQMVQRASTGQADWNALLDKCMEREHLLFAFDDWQQHQLANAVPDVPANYDPNSAMMYPSARDATARVRTLVTRATTHASWSANAARLNAFNASPTLYPGHGLYRLSMRDRQAIQLRYRGPAALGTARLHHWKHATSRDVLHPRNAALQAVDRAIASGDIRQIRQAFDAWYPGAEVERKQRPVVQALQQELASSWSFV